MVALLQQNDLVLLHTLMINVGSQAPVFTLPNQDGRPVCLSDFAGQYVLLIFYPRDNGLVCTRQLCNYRDNWEMFQQRNIVLLGLNPSSTMSHKKFAGEYKFPFPLLVDENRKVAALYQAIGMLGLPARAYVLVNPQGTVIYSDKELTLLTRHSTYKLMAIFDALHTEQKQST